jgi:hypothetical protein
MTGDRRDITGEKFGKLTAVKKIEDTRKRKICPTWLFLCDCGNQVKYPFDNVVYSCHKGRQSCGCLRKESSAKRKEFIGVTNIKDTCVERIKSKNPNKNNKCGVRGIFWNTEKKLWEAKITFQKKAYNLGRFKTKTEATKKRREAEKMLHEPFLDWYYNNIRQKPKSGLRKNNTTGYTGLYWQKNTKNWDVRIMINGVDIFIGTFKKKTDAIKARKKADTKYLYTKLLTIRDMYEKLGITRSKLRRLLKKLDIKPCQKNGNHIYYSQSTMKKIKSKL